MGWGGRMSMNRGEVHHHHDHSDQLGDSSQEKGMTMPSKAGSMPSGNSRFNVS